MKHHAVFNLLEQNLANLSGEIKAMNETILKLRVLQNSASSTPNFGEQVTNNIGAVSALDEYRTYINIIDDYISKQEKIIKKMNKYNKKSVETFHNIKSKRLFKLMEE